MIKKTRTKTRIIQKKSCLDGTTAILNHEIRTPLANLQSYCQLLAETPLSLQQQEYINVINSSVQYLLHLTHNLLEAEPTSKVTQHLNIAECIKKSIAIITPLAEKKDISLQTHYSKIPPIILGDPVKLKQILINLLTNAICASASSAITLETSFHYSSTEKIIITIKIQDSGSGIALEKQKKLKSLFANPKTVSIPSKQNNGIGLKLCHNLAKQISGEISFVSKQNQGSTFQLIWLASTTLPVAQKKVTETRAVYKKTDPVNQHLLIVEDNHSSAKLIKTFLTTLPFNIYWATTGEEAIQQTKEQLFDIIIIDIHLPQKNGLTVIKEIRKSSTLNKATPIVAMSASISAATQKTLKKAGCDVTLEKPFTQQQLHNLIDSLVVNKTKTTESKAPFINWEAAMEKLGGKTPTIIELFNDLIAEIEVTLKKLAKDKQQKNYSKMRQSLHKLHGAAAFYHLQPLKKIAGQLEDTLIKRNYDNIDYLFERLEQMIKTILSEYSEFINTN